MPSAMPQEMEEEKESKGTTVVADTKKPCALTVVAPGDIKHPPPPSAPHTINSTTDAPRRIPSLRVNNPAAPTMAPPIAPRKSPAVSLTPSMASQPDTKAGAAIYTPLVLTCFYNVWVFLVTNTLAWRCSTHRVLQPFYNRLVTRAHVEVGVGTGRYPAHAPLAPDTMLTLVDLNTASLAKASATVAAAHPRVKLLPVVADVLAPKPLPLLHGTVDSLALMYVLHCLPGGPARKSTLLSELRHALSPDGVLFGATVLGSAAPHNLFGRLLLRVYNRRGVFDNLGDTEADILEPLRDAFEHVEHHLEGAVLLFEARRPKAVV